MEKWYESHVKERKSVKICKIQNMRSQQFISTHCSTSTLCTHTHTQTHTNEYQCRDLKGEESHDGDDVAYEHCNVLLSTYMYICVCAYVQRIGMPTMYCNNKISGAHIQIYKTAHYLRSLIYTYERTPECQGNLVHRTHADCTSLRAAQKKKKNQEM